MFRRRKDDDDEEEGEVGGALDEEDEKDETKVYELVQLHHEMLPQLRSALIKGGNLTAAFEVGDFQMGGVLLAGADLDFAPLNIEGLQPGDSIDPEIQFAALEALAALADDGLEAKLNMRPKSVQDLINEQQADSLSARPCLGRIARCCKAIFRRCCGRRKWKRKRRCSERLRLCWHAVEARFIRMCFSRSSGPEKRYDVFLSAQDSDQEVASWLTKFCENRSLELFHDSPSGQARKQMKKSQHDDEEAVKEKEGEEGAEDEAPKEKKEDGAESSAGGNSARTGKSGRSGGSSNRGKGGISCVEWLKRRQAAVMSSHIVLVVLSDDCFENTWVILDCLWAYSMGVPILPVMRNSAPPDSSVLRKSLRFVFGTGVGTVTAGPGANRMALQMAIQRGVNKGLVSARSAKRRKKLPSGSVDAIIQSFRRLQFEVTRGNLEQEDNAVLNSGGEEGEEGEEGEQPAEAGDAAPAPDDPGDGHSARSHESKGSKRSQHSQHSQRSQRSGRPQDSSGRPDDTSGRSQSQGASGRPSGSGRDEEGGENVGMSLADLRHQAEAEAEHEAELARQEAELAERRGRLSDRMEERVYGVVAALALHGTDRPNLTVDGVEALRLVSRADRGCVSIADFGGTGVIMRLAHGANKNRIHKAKEDKRKGKGWFASLKRSLGGNSSRTDGSRSPKSPSGSPSRTFSFFSTKNTNATSTTASSAYTEMSAASGAIRSGDDEMDVAQSSLACIRNLAARSRERKEEILNAGGAQIAVKSMKVFSSAEYEPVRKAAAGLLRNLSAEVSLGAPILVTAGLLAVAQEELQDIAECNDLQRHLLATVQNMAAHPDAPGNYFIEGASSRWMDICADVVHHARDEGKFKLLNQALSALANLALVRAAESHHEAQSLVLREQRFQQSREQGFASERASEQEDSARASKTQSEAAVVAEQDSGDEEAEETSVKDEEASASRLRPAALRRITDGAASDAGTSVKESASASDAGTATGRRPKAKAKVKAKIVKKITKKKVVSAGRGKEQMASGWGSSLEADDMGIQASGWGSSFGSDGEPKRSAKKPDHEKAEGSDDEEEEDIMEEGEEEEAEGDEEEMFEDGEEEDEEGDWEEEGYESEEPEEDEVLEQTSSLPTDALVFEESILRAQNKVPPAVLETMLQILGKDGAEQASGLTAAATIAALCNFAQDVDIERSIGSLGGIELVLSTMANHRSSQVNLQGLRFLWNMTFSHHNQERLMAAKGLPLIFSALDTHRLEEDAELQEQGNGVLRNLATGPSGQKREIFYQGGIRVLCRTFEDYYWHPGACRQAAAAIRILADGAPPVAEEVCAVDGMRGLIKTLRNAGDDSGLADHVLHAMELVLVSPHATRPFCERKGHLEVLSIMERFMYDTTALRACRALAGALCQHEGFEEEELEESEGEELEEEEQEEDPEDDEIAKHSMTKKQWKEKEKEKELERQRKEKLAEKKSMPRIASLRMRLELLEMSSIEKLFACLENFKENLAVNEAVVGALRNLCMDIPNAPPALKPEAGDRSDILLSRTAKWIADYDNRRNAVRFVGLILTLMCSLALNSKAATILHRNKAADSALDWMNLYSNDAVVQSAGCSFLKNFAASQLRIRQTIVEIGGVGQVADILDRYIKNPDVLEEALRALHNFAMADGCGIEAAENFLVRRAFKVMDIHKTLQTLNAVGFALLWNISTNSMVNKAVIAQDGISRALGGIRKFADAPHVIGSAGGMLRNLLAGDYGEDVARKIKSERGFQTLREALYKHREHPLVAEQLLAVFSNIAVLAGIFLQMMSDEFMNKQEATRLQTIMQLHSKSSPIQFQAFSLIGRLCAFNRELKPVFNPIVPHGLQMIVAHRNTPVVDMVESVLEEIG